ESRAMAAPALAGCLCSRARLVRHLHGGACGACVGSRCLGSLRARRKSFRPWSNHAGTTTDPDARVDEIPSLTLRTSLALVRAAPSEHEASERRGRTTGSGVSLVQHRLGVGAGDGA